MNQKTALITGASSGFGEATAKKLSNHGWRIILCARRKERLSELAKQLKTESLVIQLDVTDKDAVFTAIEQIPDNFKSIDLLVNNAGLALGLDKAHEANLQDWDTMVDTNIKGLTYVTRAVLPGMVERNRGHIVNIGSIAGSWPYPGGNAYGATKAFVRQFSLNLRADLTGTKVRVTTVEPGLAETEFSLVRFKGDATKADQVYQQVEPLIGDDVAETIYWCSSLPEHVNINSIEVMPTCQSWGPLAVAKNL